MAYSFYIILVIAGATNFKDPDNQVSHVKDTRYPSCNDLNPVVCARFCHIGRGI